MFKKILPFLCSLAPFYAFGAESVDIPTNPTSVNLGAGYYSNVMTGTGINVGTGGVNVYNISALNTTDTQEPTSTLGDLYIVKDAGVPFGITSAGDINVGNKITVDATRGLKLTSSLGIDVGGEVVANGAFSVGNATSLDIGGTITSGDALSLNAGTISTGVITSTAGDTTITTTSGGLNIGGIKVSGQTAGVAATTGITSASTIQTGDMQNLAGTMTVRSSGNFTGMGNVENSGAALDINTGSGAMTVVGTMKNDSPSGILRVVAGALSVSGGDANHASFVNSGNASFQIAGNTTFAHGMNLENMSATSGLEIETVTLDLGSSNIIANNQASLVKITVTGGVLDAGTISNGTENGSAAVNTMLSGVGVNATSVQNYGDTLTIGTVSSTANDDITINGGVLGVAGTKTIVDAGDVLTIHDNVSNAGNMTLNGKDIQLLAGVSNSGAGAVLKIGAPTNNGSITVSGAVANANGQTTIQAKSVALAGGVTNTSGTMNIIGSDTNGTELSIGSIVVDGGVMNLNAWTGGVSTGTLRTNGGVLNLGSGVRSLVATNDISVDGNVYLNTAADNGSGDVYLTATGAPVTFKSSGGSLTVGGNIVAIDANNPRTAILDVADGSTITVNGTTGVNVQNSGRVVFGSSNSSSVLNVANGALNASNNGKVEIYSGDATAKSLNESANGEFIMHGNSFTATNGAINISNGVWFDDATTSTVGMVITGTDAFALENQTNNQNVGISGGLLVAADKTLKVGSKQDLSVSGTTTIDGTLNAGATNLAQFNNLITVGDESNTSAKLDVDAKTISLAGITNYGTVDLGATVIDGTITSSAAITNSGTFSATATDDITFGDFTSNKGGVTITSNGGDVQTGDFSVSAGTADVSGNGVAMNSLSLTGGNTTITSDDIDVTGAVSVSGNVVQGASGGMLNIDGTSTFDANSFAIVNTTNSSYGFTAENGTNTTYTIAGAMDFGKSMTIENGATTNISAGSVVGGDITNGGTLSLTTTDGVSDLKLGGITNNSSLTIDTGGLLWAAAFTNASTATAIITSNGMKLDGALSGPEVNSKLTNTGILYQGVAGTLSGGDINITNDNYTITASNILVGGINQSDSTHMTINTSDLNVGGYIAAKDLTIAAAPAGNWLDVTVGGDVSGGVKIFGLEHMTVGGDYRFDDNSALHAAVLPFATGIAPNTTTYDYWADVSLADDSTLGQITNHSNDPANALIHVDGKFISDVDMGNLGVALDGGPLVAPQIGINLYNVVDAGSAIWLLYADQGLQDLNTKIRNLYVNFCNADGSRCFNYFDALDDFDPASDRITNSANRDTEDDLPIYLSVRDYDNDGTTDSLYIVFDPRFGGPVKVFDIEPIVARVDDATDGEVESANALDNMIAGGLADAGFAGDSPIEAIPVAFDGTNLSELATELYNRMEQYVIDRNGTPLARFARLTQPREMEQIAGGIALNEHTSFRDFEDHMFDEFIWNRNRNLHKLWFDADFGLFRQDVRDGKTVNGNRFNLTAGFDWQASRRTVLGLAARVSHMSSKNDDTIDLSYVPGETINGAVKVDVADTNIGAGAYLMTILGDKFRLYGNAFVDAHLIDLSREQNYVDDISGSGTAFSLISEWGLMHDWLNQYIVGNLYARAGYNFGFSVREESGDDTYMRMKSDGYFIFTPGYSLTAQKRIYTSPWFQIRPYASIGIEYDVLGMPADVQYKFATAKSYSDYDVEINPLWANIGAGVELLSAIGAQFGIDYRFQYNNDIQLHNIRLSGSYRF